MTRKGSRVIASDTETVSALKTHRATQAAEKLAWGPGYKALDYVFAREDGSLVRPKSSVDAFLALSAQRGCRDWSFMAIRDNVGRLAAEESSRPAQAASSRPC
jgi:hypothetical protein